MIGRITERRAIERLTRDGRRARTPALWCRYLDQPGTGPVCVAFAVGRAVGTAVTRNRLRRRLREHVRRAVEAPGAPLSSGRLLIGASPAAAELTFEALGREVDGLLADLGSASSGRR